MLPKAQRTPNVRMTIDDDSRESESDTERHTKAAIHSPQIKNRCHKCPLLRHPRPKY
jgi:hypothetical protein